MLEDAAPLFKSNKVEKMKPKEKNAKKDKKEQEVRRIKNGNKGYTNNGYRHNNIFEFVFASIFLV